MSRPGRNGVDYFPLDVNLGGKVDLIEAEFGLKGFAVVVKLYQMIYAEQGYYCEWDDEIALLFSRKNGLGVNAVSEIVSASIRRGIFDASMYEDHHILTSAEIQKTYLEITRRRKDVKLESAYLLLKSAPIAESGGRNAQNDVRNPQNDGSYSQSKGKESKVKESKGKDDDSRARDDLAAYACANLQYLSHYNLEELLSFRDSLPDALIQCAVDQACAQGVRKYSYVRAILNGYIEKGFKTVGDVQAAEDARRKGAHNGTGYANAKRRGAAEDDPQPVGNGEKIL